MIGSDHDQVTPKKKANKLKDPIKFKRQRKLVVNLNKQTKLEYFEKLSVDCKSKPFWKACTPYLSNNSSNMQGKMMLVQRGKLLSKQKNVTLSFNKHS